MVFRVNPAFDRFPEEGTLIGRILSGFGEVEVTLCRNAAHATSLHNTLFKTFYAIRVTSTRIEVADRLMRPYFERHGLTAELNTAMGMVWHCLKIRNQYAHCNWADHQAAGLFFADLQNSAETADFSHDWKHVDPSVLQEQFHYFAMTLELLEFTHHEMAVKLGQIPSHVWPRPIIPSPPPLHNPPAEHVPPWLTEDGKALHVARARAVQGGPPTPTPGQKALDKARAESRARQTEHRRKSEQGEQRAKARSDPPKEK
jgi:hypothetical protein